MMRLYLPVQVYHWPHPPVFFFGTRDMFEWKPSLEQTSDTAPLSTIYFISASMSKRYFSLEWMGFDLNPFDSIPGPLILYNHLPVFLEVFQPSYVYPDCSINAIYDSGQDCSAIM